MTDQKASNAVKSLLHSKPAPLGRGLSALFGDSDSGYQAPAAAMPPVPERGQKQLPVSWISPGRFQPRRHFDDTALQELADSIREHGVLQPLLVRPVPNERDRYEIIAGERRWRAAQRAGVHDVPVIIRELSDADTLEIALIENIQRQDLSALEEAEGYQRLINEFNHTYANLAKIIGKSQSHIANTMRLLNLPDSIKQLLQEGQLTPGHARGLLMADDPEALAAEIIRDKLTVRDVEARIRKPKLGEVAGAAGAVAGLRRGITVAQADANTLALEQDLTSALGLKVKLSTHNDGSGAISIAYKTLDQLEELIGKLRG